MIGLDQPMVSRGIATADVDGDGRLDFALANQWGPSYFFRNEAPKPGAFLGLHLLLPSGKAIDGVLARAGHPATDTPGRPAIGAVASVRLPGQRQLISHVDGGSGHSGRRSADIHFGLGQTDGPVTVELRWRDTTGAAQQATLDLQPGWHTIVLGKQTTRLAATQGAR